MVQFYSSLSLKTTFPETCSGFQLVTPFNLFLSKESERVLATEYSFHGTVRNSYRVKSFDSLLKIDV